MVRWRRPRSILIAPDGVDDTRVQALLFGDGVELLEVGDRIAVEGRAEATIYTKTGQPPAPQLGIVATWWRPIGAAGGGGSAAAGSNEGEHEAGRRKRRNARHVGSPGLWRRVQTRLLPRWFPFLTNLK
jgi:hypothetical protein